MKDGITVEQAKILYNMNYDNWVSSCTRISTFSGKCIGNTEHKHNFFNHDYDSKIPNTYRVVIINNDTGETKITDVINRIENDSFITINVDTMEVTNNTKEILTNAKIEDTAILFIISMLLTSIIEIIFAIIMKICNIKNIVIILVINIIKNLILSVGFIASIPYLFIIIGTLVFVAEYFAYNKVLNDVPKTGILTSTLVSTIISIMFFTLFMV